MIRRTPSGLVFVSDLRAFSRSFLVLAAVAAVLLGQGAFAKGPIVVHTTLITGPDQHVDGPTAPGVGLADLDQGLVAGNVRYVYDGYIWIPVRVPFLWSEKTLSATLFDPPEDFATAYSFYVANGWTPDPLTVVGAVAFTEKLTMAAWIWTDDGSRQLDFLPCSDSDCGALSITKDGRLVAGVAGGRFSPGRAVVWRDRLFEELPSSQPWSEVGSVYEPEAPAYQRRMTLDGSIIVGASGPAQDQMQATRWVHGVERPLDTGGATSSVAMFVTESGVIFGTGVLASGRIVMMRWIDGNLEVLEPPDALSIVNLSSIDSSGHAAGGALAKRQSCISSNDPLCNRAPVVWTDPPYGPHGGIWTILPENGHADFYNRSIVTDVSDGGQVATGALIPAVRTDGDPPIVAFLWSPKTGLVIVNDIMPQLTPRPDYYYAHRLSRNGKRVLVTGNPPQQTSHDTNSLILDLAWP